MIVRITITEVVMRKFRASRETLRDIRIAYTFLLSAAIIATITGILAVRYGEELRSREISSLRAALTLCGDSLTDWSADSDYESRCLAAANFSAAMATLPYPTDIEALSKITDGMISGEISKELLKTFSDTFFLLSELDYESPREAKKIAAETLNGVCELLYPVSEISTGNDVPPEVAKYNRKIAEDTVDKVIGLTNSGLDVEIAEENLVAEAGNIRMKFSKEDGSLEEFVYIRLNGKKGEILDREGQINAAISFFNTVVRHRRPPSVDNTTEVCGFMTVRLVSGEESWLITVDERGNVWGFSKTA